MAMDVMGQDCQQSQQMIVSLFEHGFLCAFAFLLDGRDAEVLEVALVPVLHHQLRPLLHLRHASLPQLPVRPADLGQEVDGRDEGLNLVVFGDFIHGDAFDDGLDDFLEGVVVLGGVLQDELVAGEVLLEDDSGTVEELDLAVELDLLQGLGAAGDAGDVAGLVALETVDDAALADVGVADESHGDCAVGAFHLGDLLDELDEVVGADGLGGVDEGVGHVGAVGDGLLEEVEGGEVRALALQVRLEHHYWELPPQVGLPGVGVFHRHQVDLVQHQHDLLVRHRQDLPLDVLAAAGERVARIQDLQDDVAGLDDLLYLLPVSPRFLEVLPLDHLEPVIFFLIFLFKLCLLHEVLNVWYFFLFQIFDDLVAVGLFALEGLDHPTFELGEVGGLIEILIHWMRVGLLFLAFPWDFCILKSLRFFLFSIIFFWLSILPINNRLSLLYYPTMHHDDLVLNITTTPHAQKLPPAVTANSSRRNKYSFAAKKERANSFKKPQFQYNLLPTQEQPRQEDKHKQGDKAGEERHIKRDRNNEYDRQERNYNQFEGSKRVKQEDELKAEDFNASKLKITTPEEIKPEVVPVQNKIDVNSLEEYKLSPLLQDSLIKNGITKFTEVQKDCYKPIFAGRDVIAKASTGSGKTLAYLIPLINQYIEKKIITQRDCGTVMLIICPSRELCIQGQKEVLRCLKRCPFIVPGMLIGGEQTNHEKNRLRRGVNILFCTPGRLMYHLQNTQAFKYANLKTIIFEEADRTLDMGFQQSVHKILDFMAKNVKSEYYQKILVSAHFNEKVEALLTDLTMDNPQYIGFEDVKQEEGEEGEEGGKFHHQEINISKNVKQQYVLMTEEERIPLMISYLRLIKDSKVLIFVNTIDEVEYLDYLLTNMKYRDSNGNFTNQNVEQRRIFKIHGDLDQKYRSNTYFEFRKEKSAIMVSTEVASRGLDFPDLNHIILFDVPATITDYGNRVGRTARYNSSGVSLLMLHYQESDYAEQIRYYAPSLELLDKDIIFGGFEQHMHRLNIREKGLYYIEGMVRSLVKDDDEKFQLARKAYTSMLRAYAKLKDKQIFAIKKLDLKLLGRCFGINSTGGRAKTYNANAKESHFEALKKKRKPESLKKLQVSEYL